MCLHAAKRSGRNCVVSEADEKLFAAVAGPPRRSSRGGSPSVLNHHSS